MHDFTPGVLTNGVFWTIAIPDDAFRVRRKRAVLDLHDTPLCDSFFFGNCQGVASQASTRLVWRATTERIERGEGLGADPNTPGAFSGQLSDATCEGKVSGRQTGFDYRTPGKLDASGFYANFGHARNGAFLT